MPAKKLKPKVPDVTDIAREDVEVVRGLLRNDKKKVIGTSETFDRIVPRDRVGIVEIATSVDNLGKTLAEIPVEQLKFKRITFK